MRDIDRSLARAYARLSLKPGDIYESCSYHPVLCLGVDYRTDEIWGISLVDGSYPHFCSLLHCGIRKLTSKQAWKLLMHGPPTADERERIPKGTRWWTVGPDEASYRVGLVPPRPPRTSLSASQALPTPPRRQPSRLFKSVPNPGMQRTRFARR